MTYCTGNRTSTRFRSDAMCTCSRWCSSAGPSYHGLFGDRVTMLSPCRAEIGTIVRSGASSLAANAVNSSAMDSKTSSDQSTRSILLTHNTRCGTRSSEHRNACRRDSSTRTLRASTTISARSAVDAPVTMLRVYWMWPGVSAMMNFRRGVAKYRYATSIVMPCSRSARRPSVSSARFVYSSPRERDVASTASSWSEKMAFESYSSRPISVDLPSSTEPAVAKRRRSICRCCGVSSTEVMLEVPLTLAVFHGRLAHLVVAAGRPALGDAGGRDLVDHLVDRVRVAADGGGAGRV